MTFSIFAGEFVEGKEKLKLIVDKVYKSAKELQSSLFEMSRIEDSDDDDGTYDADFDQELQLDVDLCHDIEELGEAEQKMLQQADPDADDIDGEPALTMLEYKLPAKENPQENSVGRSEDDAIALSDDDEEPTENEKPISNFASASFKAAEPKQALTRDQSLVDRNAGTNDSNDILSGGRLYRIIFGETTLGLDVTLYEGRIVVAKVSVERLARLGEHSKPAVGDILAAIAGHSLGLIANLSATLQYLKQALQSPPPVELMFIEAPNFMEAFQKQSLLNKALEIGNSQQQQQQPSVAPPQIPADISSFSNDVIDLLDGNENGAFYRPHVNELGSFFYS
jgi:hypothetical protein